MKSKVFFTIASIYLAAGLVAACASAPKNSKNEIPTPAAKSAVPSAADVRDKYTISQLDAASTALKVIADASKDTKADTGSDVIGCPVTAGKASAMRFPLQSLIDGRLGSEREAYSAGPNHYGDTNSFETCAANCSCGVLNQIVNGASTAGFKPNDKKYHERWEARLKLKSSALGEREMRACAVHQNWLCGSDLMKYLESQAAGQL